MPTIVANNSQKRVPNVKPLNRPQPPPAVEFTNIIFPFGKKYGPKILGHLNSRLKGYRRDMGRPKIPVPGEGLPRILNYCADQSGCAFWRMIWPGNELLAHNKAVIMTFYQMILEGRFYQGIDAIRLQRQCTDMQIEFIKFLRDVSNQLKKHTGKDFRIIWEVDDLVAPSEDIPDYNVCKGGFENENVLRNLLEMVKYVDEITVVSDFMRKHYKKHLNFDKITVIPNYAPRSWLDRGFEEKDAVERYKRLKDRKKPRVLYAGSGTHFDVSNRAGQKDDFEHVVEAIAQDILIHKKYEWVFMGALPLKLKQFVGHGIEFHDWCAITEYPQKLKSLNVDVSIAPLQNNNFSRAKANIKLTEAGAQGVPCIAQNLECYNSDGWPYLFDDVKQMFAHIDTVTSSEEKYLEACRFARQYAEGYFADKHLDEYLLLYSTEYGDTKRKENQFFLRNNPEQFA